jgi:hypothetical protein
MNSRQRVILGVGLVAVAAMCLVPPWEWTSARPTFPLSQGPAGYGLVFSPPDAFALAAWRGSTSGEAVVGVLGERIDIARLFIQFIAVAGLAGAVLLAASGRRRDGGA